jgi:predicted 3-demethylubiquinone-9 3-methyltransferase (glyoxalase superfamily)
MNKIAPFLWFNNCALAAAHYYTTIFKDSKIESIMHKSDSADDVEENVLTVSFSIEGQSFIGLNGGNEFQFSEAISFSIACENQEEIDYYWKKLTEEGLEVQCGWLKDKYGVSWQVVPKNMGELMYSKDPNKAKMKMEKMLGMKKIVIDELKSI